MAPKRAFAARTDPAACTLVGCWIQYAAPVELGGDFLFAHSGKAERKNEPYCFGGLRVDHKMIVICRVLFIAIRRETADILPGAAFLCKDCPDVFRQVLQIPFVDKPVDLAGLFAAAQRRIHMVDDRNETNSPHRKKPVDIFFHKLQIACKARLRFT